MTEKLFTGTLNHIQNKNKKLNYILSKNSSAHLGFRVNSILTRTGCIQCYISLFREIILQPMGEHKIEIECTLTKLCPF